MKLKFESSYKTVVFTILFVLGLGFAYFIRDLIIQVFVALLLAAILDPYVTKLQKIKFPRGLSVLIVYIFFVGLIVLLLVSITQPVIEQSTNLANNLPSTINQLKLPKIITSQVENEIAARISDIPKAAVGLTVAFLSNIVSVLYVLVLTAYLLIARPRLGSQLSGFLPEDVRLRLVALVTEIENKLGSWARGEFVLMTVVGVFTYLGLSILGVPYSLPLALLAGILEIVPNFGPILAAVPAVLVGFGVSPVVGVATIALVFIIQQVENYIFIPRVMEKSVGVNPLVTLLALVIGLRVAGVVGGIVSIPIVLSAGIVIEHSLRFKKQSRG